MIKGKGIQEIGQSGGQNSYLPNLGILPLPTYDGRQRLSKMIPSESLISNFAL
jgi:hypothetical protein